MSDEPNYFQSLRNFYQSCMDRNSIEAAGSAPLLTILEKIGGWPVLKMDRFDEQNFNWLKALIKIRNANLFFQSIMKFHVKQMEFGQYILAITKPKAHLIHFINQDLLSAIIRNFPEQLIGVQDEIAQMAEFEAELLAIYPRDLSQYRIVQLNDLYKLFPGIDWNQIFQLIWANNNFQAQLRIIIMNDVYLKQIPVLMNKFSKRFDRANSISILILFKLE